MVVVAIVVDFQLSVEEKRKMADLKLGVRPCPSFTELLSANSKLPAGPNFSGVHSQ